MIMGVQRSGTTALFDALAAAPGISARNESKSDEIYEDYFLRPGLDIQAVLHSLPGTVLLKPVRESERRTPLEVAEEYRDYDLRIIWPYRDPVNVFFSYVRLGWCKNSPASALRFATEWSKRNTEAVGSAGLLGKKLLVVRYEDLTHDRFLLEAFAKILGLRISGAFGMDSSGGRKTLPQEIQSCIEINTAAALARLKGLRSLRPSTETSASGAGLSVRFFRRIGLLRKKGNQIAVKELAYSDEYNALFETPDVGPVYRFLRKAGPVRLDSKSGSFVAIGYDACRGIHAASVPLVGHEPSLWDVSGESARRAGALENFFAKHRPELCSRIAGEVRETCSNLPMDEAFDLAPHLSLLADRLATTWLGLPVTDEKECSRVLHRMARLVASTNLLAEWKIIRETVEGTGMISELLREGLLLPGETSDFVRETCLPLQALSLVVENTLVVLREWPDAMERVRANPSFARDAIDEALRLSPIFLGIKRRLTRPVELHGLALAVGSKVDLLVGAANRDPDAFHDPDTFHLDRQSPAPFLLESESVPFTRLKNERRRGCNHLVFDAAALTLQNLLLDPRSLRIEGGKNMSFYIQQDGSCIQTPMGVRLLIGNHPLS